MKIKNLTITSVFLALTFIITKFVQIPIPLGYFTIANAFILLSCLILPSPYGIYSSSLGSALADLVSYPVYSLPTLIIKALMPIVFYSLNKKNSILAASISTIIPLIGYTATGCVLYGGFYAGLAQFPGLFAEYVFNLIVFITLQKSVKNFSF